MRPTSSFYLAHQQSVGLLLHSAFFQHHQHHGRTTETNPTVRPMLNFRASNMRISPNGKARVLRVHVVRKPELTNCG
jgi:hypothetical protein